MAVSVAVHFFGASVSTDFQWVGSWMALIILTTATIVEMCAYYIPWVDNVLDLINGPLALAAGAVVMCGMLPEMNSAVKWSIAVIVGSGAAGLTQSATTETRGASSAATGGLGNCVVATIENAASIVLSLLALVLPILAAFFTIGIFLAIIVRLRDVLKKRHLKKLLQRRGI